MVTVIVILIVLALIAAIAFLVSDKVKDLFHLGGKTAALPTEHTGNRAGFRKWI